MRTQAKAQALEGLREEFGGLAPPVIVFNKSHSGSRLLAEVLSAGGIFMGAERNESHDSMPLFDVVDALVRGWYPDYSPLWDPQATQDPGLASVVRASFERHLAGHDRSKGAPWGWKLCETVYALPVFDRIFPEARYVHLVRDGRDVAFCDHKGPTDPFWRKVYFDTDRIRTFRGMPLDPGWYRRRSHAFNAQHWTNSVRLGRAFGAMLRERCLEVRYEDLCGDFDATADRVLRFVGAPAPREAIDRLRPSVGTTSIGKWRHRPRRELAEVIEIEKPLLLALGYLESDPEPPRPSPWNLGVAKVAGRGLRNWRSRSAKRG